VLLDYALVLYNFDFRSVAQPPRATDDGGVEPDLPGSAPTTSAPEAHSDSLPSTSPSTGADSSAAESLASPAAEDRGGPGQGLDGEAGPCPPHSYPRGAKGNAPCKKCGQWGDAG
jgi:hypothetical protein